MPVSEPSSGNHPLYGQSGSRHPEHAYVGADGMRNLTMEEYVHRVGDRIHVNDRDGEGVVRLDLTPGALDFLIDSLPQHDLFTEQLRYARRLSKELLWEREAA